MWQGLQGTTANIYWVYLRDSLAWKWGYGPVIFVVPGEGFIYFHYGAIWHPPMHRQAQEISAHSRGVGDNAWFFFIVLEYLTTQNFCLYEEQWLSTCSCWEHGCHFQQSWYDYWSVTSSTSADRGRVLLNSGRWESIEHEGSTGAETKLILDCLLRQNSLFTSGKQWGLRGWPFIMWARDKSLFW